MLYLLFRLIGLMVFIMLMAIVVTARLLMYLIVGTVLVIVAIAKHQSPQRNPVRISTRL